MVSHLTNNETYFFREAPQLQVFADHVLRQTQGAQGARPATARCASSPPAAPRGEEAHTLAMIVYDSGQFFWNWDVQVIGHGRGPGGAGEGAPRRVPPQLLPRAAARP